MFFPYHIRNPYYDSENELNPQGISKFNFSLPSNLMKKRLERTIASTLFLETLTNFTSATRKIETKITSRTPIWNDISLLEEHIREIRDFRKVLNLRVKLIKKEISRMRGLQKL